MCRSPGPIPKGLRNEGWRQGAGGVLGMLTLEIQAGCWDRPGGGRQGYAVETMGKNTELGVNK